MEQFGYEFGPLIRPRTLDELLRLHQIVLQAKGIHVAQLKDNELRKMLLNSGHRVGPINSSFELHFIRLRRIAVSLRLGVTRAIYQRTLLETLADETIYESQGESGSEQEEDDRPNERDSIVLRRQPKDEEIDPVIPTAKEVKKSNRIFLEIEMMVASFCSSRLETGDTILYAGIVLFVGSVIFIFYLYF